MNLRRTVLAFPAAMAAVGMSFVPAASAAAEVDHFNDHDIVVVLEDSLVPCVGPADVTLTVNQMYHYSENDNGSHERWVFTGTFEAALDEGGTSVGQVTFTDVADNTRSEGQYIVETDAISGKVLSGVGAGTKWNWVTHFTGPIDDEGEWIVDLAKAFFVKERCH